MRVDASGEECTGSNKGIDKERQIVWRKEGWRWTDERKASRFSCFWLC